MLRLLLLVAALVFGAVTWDSLSAAEDITDFCLKRAKTQAEFRDCRYKTEREQGKALKSKACGKNACIYRLARVSGEPFDAGVYKGSGYTLRTSPLSDGLISSRLVDTKGGVTHFEHFCGAGGCPGNAEAVRGALKGASYTMVLEAQPHYVILRVPR